jgi:hypothetical protein
MRVERPVSDTIQVKSVSAPNELISSVRKATENETPIALSGTPLYVIRNTLGADPRSARLISVLDEAYIAELPADSTETITTPFKIWSAYGIFARNRASVNADVDTPS